MTLEVIGDWYLNLHKPSGMIPLSLPVEARHGCPGPKMLTSYRRAVLAGGSAAFSSGRAIITTRSRHTHLGFDSLTLKLCRSMQRIFGMASAVPPARLPLNEVQVDHDVLGFCKHDVWAVCVQHAQHAPLFPVIRCKDARDGRHIANWIHC